ncbi:CapA family protein [Paenibacillus typhae]|uniref:Poly-gamma-glutamate synthesis protein (Capsule biosynthesis protein) n=2 Tax=Paenibacillus typhae TaxID=1174501 RepID=A0A1G8EYV5_9BACL|nr:poly-gamma-glutamate synthesis protein (capsule biosynthesis protein) [Paenibacillus typhae]
MYPPRSQSREKDKHSSKRRRRRAWAWINVSLLLLITAMLTYYFAKDGGNSPAAQPPPAESTASPPPSTTPELPAVQPSLAADLQPEATVTPEPVQTPVSAEEATPAPSPSPETAATPSPLPSPDNSKPDDEQGSGAAQGGAASGLPEDAGGQTVTLNFAGDVIFAGKVAELLQKQGYNYSYSALDGMFKKDDLTVVNLETPITTGGVGAADKQFVFKGAPEALDALKSAGVDAVNLANNHTLDQGEQGLLDTLNHLNTRGIPYVGAGKNSKEAYTAQYFERNGIKIALLGFTRVIPRSDWAAGSGKPGLASVYDSTEALKTIAAVKQKADIVVVMVHWGKERVEQYDSTQQTLGRSFIDAGADLVIGGHPHVLQGIEPYQGKWIAYSTGNFIFTRSATPATWETAVFQAECSIKGQCSLTLHPMYAELGRPVPMNDADGQLLLNKVQSLSAGLIRIGSDGRVSQAGR